ncbi:MAG: Kazal-type serine protease inhibitor [Nanoarchaeota archaeon]
MKFNKRVIYLSIFLILALFLISACKNYNAVKISEDESEGGNINRPPRCIDCAAPNPNCRYILQPGEDPCKTCGKLVCEEEEEPKIKILRSASILNLPIPENSKCFYHINYNLSECSQYYDGRGDLVCPKFYNPVYGSNGIFYPSACWAEHFGITNYSYGYSSQLKQFINDLWFTKKIYQSIYFKVPMPNIEFTYQGSGLEGWRNGVFLRSVLWKNNSKFYILDYNIDTQDGTQQSTSFTGYNTFVSVYGTNPKSLLVFVMFDNAYPENVLLEWTNTYEPLMNDYIRKKQKVPNPVQYDLVPVVIDPPQGVKRPSSPDHLYFTQEEMQKVFDAATNKIGKSDFDVFIMSPVFLNGFGGYFSWWNNMQFIEAPLHPPESYSDRDKQKGLDALSAFQSMFLTISHEILHAVGLPGDHVPMGYGTMYLDAIGQDVDAVTGKRRMGEISWCDFFGASPDYYSVEIPDSLGTNVGEEPPWLYKSESSTGPCLSDLYDNEWLKDYDKDGKYEIMYKNNLIGIELQRSLGWVDVDGEGVAELIDPNPYGDYEEFIINDEQRGERIGPFKFTFIEYQNIGGCKFGRIRLENDLIGLVPLECVDFDENVVNVYNNINYYWIKIEDSHYGTVLLARLSSY